MSAARELANFLTGVTPPDLPAQAMDHAAVLIASTLASAAMGSTLESSRIVKDMAVSLGGSARASIWFDKAGPKLPVVYAAQVNAVMSDAAASDDSDLRTIVHCGTPLVATALAAAEHHGGTGEEVLAAMAGIQAVRAAQRGYKAEERILEMKLGFFEAVGGVDGNEGAALATRDRGGSWDIVTDMAVKLVPGGHPYHALAEAAANAARKAQAAAEAIESITVSRPGLTALSGPLHPKDLVDMAHSPAFFTAAGAADRDFSWANATPAKIADPVIHSLIHKVRDGLPPTDTAERYRQGATVTIALRDGRSFTSTVYAPKGSGQLGIAWNDIDAKFRALAPLGGLGGDAISRTLDIIHAFRRPAGVSPLLDLLRPAN